MTQDDDTLKKRIDEIAKIVGRDHAQPAEIKKALADFDRTREHLERVGKPRQYRYGWPQGKDDKKTAESVALALKRVEDALDRDDVLDLVVRSGGPLRGDGDAFREWAAQIGHFRERFADFANRSLKPRPRTVESRTKREAVNIAARLLKDHGLPLRKTRWCSIAAAIYGDSTLRSLHFESYTRAYQKAAAKRSAP